MGHLTLLAVAFVSALVPVVNLEIYLGGVALLGQPLNGWEMAGLAAVAAAGQLAGKTLFYFAGRGVLTLPRRFLPAALTDGSTSARRTRMAARMRRWKQQIQDRRWLSGVLVGASAAGGLPPFALVSVAAGTLRVPLPVFVMAGLAGRWVRFAVVLALVQASGV